MSGIELAELPVDRMLNVVHSLAVDDEVLTHSIQVEEDKVEVFNRRRAREALSEQLGDEPATGEKWDPDTWGLLPEHQAATRAALSLVGGPAGTLGGS